MNKLTVADNINEGAVAKSGKALALQASQRGFESPRFHMEEDYAKYKRI